MGNCLEISSSGSTQHDVPNDAYTHNQYMNCRNTQYSTGTQHFIPTQNVSSRPSMVQKPSASQSTQHCTHTQSVSSIPSMVQRTSASQSTQEFHEERGDQNKIKVNLLQITKPPDSIKNLKDFLNKWSVWKEQFMSFLTVIDEKHENYQMWGKYFLNSMGSVAQEICSLLLFDKEGDNRDYKILIKKFDSFYEFKKATKLLNESPAEYIARLKNKAALDIKNLDELLKDKMAKDIKRFHKERFIALASSMLPYFKFETSFKSLTLGEILFLWDICEKSTVSSNTSCRYCGSFHEDEKCPALGTKCDRCNCENHFTNCCPGRKYIINCHYCGGDHNFRQCLAYGEACGKCGKLHHFSWKCGNKMLLSNCHFCGLSHINNRNTCPAKNSLCAICKVRGHYDIKCDNLNKKNV